MAFSKFAYASLIKPDIHIPVWDRVRDGAQALGSAFASREASKITLAEFAPKSYMLSHCTIVASVDTENGPAPLGQHMEGGFTVDRQFQDYYITPKTAPWINNNHDAWERKLLLASYRTFIGGENYVEHLQIPEMSKGKIIDACARDIGESVYIDILVATHRKHAPLIAAVTSHKLQTLSMGANVAHTTCTKCGNVAADATQLCPHIKYEKGNKFLDLLGIERKIAELCGHVADEPGSNKFIEASWVGNPAFKGAVIRSILTAEEASVYDKLHAPRLQVAFSSPARVADPNSRVKAARSAFDFGGQEEQFPGGGQQGQGEESTPKEEPVDPLESAVDDLAKHLREKAVNKVREDMSGPRTPGNDSNERHNNETLIREASQSPVWRRIASTLQRATQDHLQTRKMLLGLLLHKAGGWHALQASHKFSGREVLAISRVLDRLQGIPSVAGEARIYRTVLAVGGAGPYGDVDTYLTACGRVLGREPTPTERAALVTKGRLFDLGR
jgi:hypothetical protein